MDLCAETTLNGGCSCCIESEPGAAGTLLERPHYILAKMIDSGAIIAPGLVRARHGARTRSQPAPVSCSTRATRFLYRPGRFGYAASSGVRYTGSEW